ncbi:hypothetical protein [Bradyrhizobium sp.]|uniref:hypothetical protein n=1 Tax=Bradyrhizobium sp. TaxID=376 RepID=UPI00239AAE43|nr:hypothetical protein [Bradyrhizobium sp.]MDE2376937.1 hypothetical protein [Bradyrhizobium sp.]
MNIVVHTALVIVLLTVPALAQKLVDPATVAPEYRAAAEKRRAEQIKLRDCSKKADVAKVSVRDRSDFVIKCLDADASR